jgi:hypothetical protein
MPEQVEQDDIVRLVDHLLAEHPFVVQARSAIGKGVRYGLGCGGLHPEDALPAREILHTPHGSPVAVLAKWCDCSGFIAWVVGRSRKPDSKFKWWLSTDSIVSDAKGNKVLFDLLPHAEIGCLAVYPDHAGEQGHVALVVDPNKHTIIDCSGSHDGVTEHDGSYFWRKPETLFVKFK